MNLSTLNEFPPILCRLLARKRYGAALSAHDIAKASGLSLVQVEAFSQQTDWRGIDVYQAGQFVRGCALNPRNALGYLSKGPTFLYLRNDSLWAEYYLPLLKRWAVSANPQKKPLRQLITRLAPIIK